MPIEIIKDVLASNDSTLQQNKVTGTITNLRRNLDTLKNLSDMDDSSRDKYIALKEKAEFLSKTKFLPFYKKQFENQAALLGDTINAISNIKEQKIKFQELKSGFSELLNCIDHSNTTRELLKLTYKIDSLIENLEKARAEDNRDFLDSIKANKPKSVFAKNLTHFGSTANKNLGRLTSHPKTLDSNSKKSTY